MAPEQAAGRKDLTVAADVYSLGVILYERLTGQTPFTGDNVLTLLRQVRESEPPRPSSIRPGLDRDLETVVPEVPGEGAGPAISVGRGAGRRPGQLAGRAADHGAAGGPGRTVLALVPAQPGRGGTDGGGGTGTGPGRGRLRLLRDWRSGEGESGPSRPRMRRSPPTNGPSGRSPRVWRGRSIPMATKTIGTPVRTGDRGPLGAFPPPGSADRPPIPG